MSDDQLIAELEQLTTDVATAEAEALEQGTRAAEARKNAALARVNREMDMLFRGMPPPWQRVARG